MMHEYRYPIVFALFFALIVGAYSPETVGYTFLFLSLLAATLIFIEYVFEPKKEKTEEQIILPEKKDPELEQPKEELPEERKETYRLIMSEPERKLVLRRRIQRERLYRYLSLFRKALIIQSETSYRIKIEETNKNYSIAVYRLDPEELISQTQIIDWIPFLENSLETNSDITIHLDIPKECFSSNLFKKAKAFKELKLRVDKDKIYFWNFFTEKEEWIDIKTFNDKLISKKEKQEDK